MSWALLLPTGQDTGFGGTPGRFSDHRGSCWLLPTSLHGCEADLWVHAALHHPASLAAGQKGGVAVGYTQTPSLVWSSPCKGEQRVSYRLPSTGCFLCRVGTRGCTWFSLTSVAPSSPLTASFFMNSLLIFTTSWLLFSFLPVTSPLFTSTFLNILFITFLLFFSP